MNQSLEQDLRTIGRAWKVFLFAALLSMITSMALSPARAHARTEDLSPGTEVFLVTIGPGELVWERFGHNGIWIRDEEKGFDRVYHWGLFDFQSENFWPKFLKGYMDYSIGSIAAPQFFQYNMESNRSIWVQEINLIADQKNALVRLLKKNDSEGNRIYRYDYYLDNCSTRARDALDAVLGGAIKQAAEGRGSGKSFRSNTRRLLQMMPLPYLGIQLGLGHPADEEISIWRDMFTPMSLRRHLNTIKLPGGAPLVKSDKFIYSSSKITEPETLRSYLYFFLPVSASLGLLFATLGYLSAAGKRPARLLLGLFGALWALLSGGIGIILVVIWGFTEHRFGHWNENILQFNPLSLILAGFLAVLLFRGRLSKTGMKCLYAVTALSMLGFILQALPVFDQTNAEIISLALPPHLGLLWAVRSAGPAVLREKGRGRTARAPSH
ncbi:MAG: DUF4105 domain-containing protein [Nitrospiria bacterium]